MSSLLLLMALIMCSHALDVSWARSAGSDIRKAGFTVVPPFLSSAQMQRLIDCGDDLIATALGTGLINTSEVTSAFDFPPSSVGPVADSLLQHVDHVHNRPGDALCLHLRP
eukprot:TRINITY_DN4804_c0_g3_i1.p1 TRINITY_DN4804_c0_g3~~TRINITY_DN4804_c0_g3_i1.p1  ORF type:complete len:111 (-),score=12.76 TRINITY_DN4804_c0_g3_i1:49-381(-)